MNDVLPAFAMHDLFIVISLVEHRANTFLLHLLCTNDVNDRPNIKEFMIVIVRVSASVFSAASHTSHQDDRQHGSKPPRADATIQARQELAAS